MGNKSNRLKDMKVPEPFHKKIKIEATRKGKTMADLMRELAKDDRELSELLTGEDKKKKGEKGGRPLFDI